MKIELGDNITMVVLYVVLFSLLAFMTCRLLS